MPGVLVVEAMAQAGAVLLLTEFPDRKQKLVFFTGIERARFRRPVIPGDQLRIEVDVLSWRRIAGRMEGRVLVDGKLAADDHKSPIRYDERAIELLERAEKAGFFDTVEHASSKSAFDRLRGRKGFQTIIARLWVHERDNDEVDVMERSNPCLEKMEQSNC